MHTTQKEKTIRKQSNHLPVSNAQLHFKRRKCLPKACIYVCLTSTFFTMIVSSFKTPKLLPHQVGNAQSRRSAHSSTAMNQNSCARTLYTSLDTAVENSTLLVTHKAIHIWQYACNTSKIDWFKNREIDKNQWIEPSQDYSIARYHLWLVSVKKLMPFQRKQLVGNWCNQPVPPPRAFSMHS